VKAEGALGSLPGSLRDGEVVVHVDGLDADGLADAPTIRPSTAA
jgi:hypothetical protein